MSDFDMRAYLDSLAEQWPPEPFTPLVNRREATVLAGDGLVEGRDFEVYPELPEDNALATTFAEGLKLQERRDPYVKELRQLVTKALREDAPHDLQPGPVELAPAADQGARLPFPRHA